MGYAFISYSTKNQSFADSTKKLFKDAGIETWMAPYDIPPGSKYAEVINQAVKNCSCCVLLLSNDSQKSIWVSKEVERAINYKKTVIPVQIDDVVLNDEFEFYISTNQIIAVKKIDKSLPEVRNLINTVGGLTDSEVVLEEKHTSLSLNKDDELNYNRALKINELFKDFLIDAIVVSFKSGPTYTLFDVELGDNQNVRDIEKHLEDMAIRLNTPSVRFSRFINGKTTCGLEINNEERKNIELLPFLESIPFSSTYNLLVPFGKDVLGQLYYGDLVETPHMLIGGSAGSGKTTFLHSLIYSLLKSRSPNDLRLVLIDPKRIELTPFKDIPHLLCPIVNKEEEAPVVLEKLVGEMNRRYDLFADASVREIKEYNKVVDSKEKKLPYIVVVIDEYADLVCTNKTIRHSVISLVQKSRASGIHIVISTQRPSVDVFDTVLKANCPTRVCFQTPTFTDSVSLINEGGAEKLGGSGDALICFNKFNRAFPIRVQCCYVSVKDIKTLCEEVKAKYELHYNKNFLDLSSDTPKQIVIDSPEEELYKRVKEDIIDKEYCSISYIIRTFGVGFARAGRIFKRLMDEGYISKDGGPRGSRVLYK